MAQCMITTSDNPYDPFTHYDEWDAFDRINGYYTSAYLARETNTSHELPESLYEEEVENKIDEMVKMNLTGKEGVYYKKVYPK